MVDRRVHTSARLMVLTSAADGRQGKSFSGGQHANEYVRLYAPQENVVHLSTVTPANGAAEQTETSFSNFLHPFPVGQLKLDLLQMLIH